MFTRRFTSAYARSGGPQKRARWMNEAGMIIEWDSRRGTVEAYNKRGRHLGEVGYLVLRTGFIFG